MGGSNTLGALTELEVQPDMIDEQAKKNSQDKESQMLTKSHVPGEEGLYFCICASFLSGTLVCSHMCVQMCLPVRL